MLQDGDLQRAFESNGFVRLPPLDPGTLSPLREKAFRLLPEEMWTPAAPGSAYHCSFIHADKERRRQVQALFAAAFDPYVRKHLKGYRVLHAALHVKPPGGGRLPLHMNWSSVADLNRSTVTLWCPLVDVSKDNGTLEVIPGSHRITRLIEDHSPRYFNDYYAVLAGMAVAQPASAGEVVLMEDTLLHGSQDNLADQPRIAAQVVCVPEDETPVYYHPTAPDLYEVIKVDADFFIDFDLSAVKARQDSWTSLGFVRRPEDRITPAEFKRRIKHPAEIRRRGFGLEPARGPRAK